MRSSSSSSRLTGGAGMRPRLQPEQGQAAVEADDLDGERRLPPFARQAEALRAHRLAARRDELLAGRFVAELRGDARGRDVALERPRGRDVAAEAAEEELEDC